MGHLAAQLLFAVQAIKQHGVPSYLLVCTYDVRTISKFTLIMKHSKVFRIMGGFQAYFIYPEHHKSFLNNRNYTEFLF